MKWIQKERFTVKNLNHSHSYILRTYEEFDEKWLDPMSDDPRPDLVSTGIYMVEINELQEVPTIPGRFYHKKGFGVIQFQTKDASIANTIYHNIKSHPEWDFVDIQKLMAYI